jgi:hypothetical protein
MNNLFFWIIILSFLIPIGLRMYRKSVQKREQGGNFYGQNPGGFPGQGRPNNAPRDGYTQQDYMSGGFGLPPARDREQLPPLDQPYPNTPYPQFPQAGQVPQPGSVPYEDSPEYRANPPQPQQARPPQQETGPVTPPPPSAPQGYRARKLAELDQQYSNGEISMEEYMSRRNDIMNG